jgi:hypothetical protein
VGRSTVLSILIGLSVAASASAQQPAAASAGGEPPKFNFSLRAGAGRGRFVNLARDECAVIRSDFGLTCSGDDAGWIWEVGFGAEYAIKHVFDVGTRVDVIRAPDVTINASGSGPGVTLTTTGRSTGHTIRIAGELGFRPHPRIRPFIGVGLHRFNLKSEQSITVNGGTDTETQNYSNIVAAWHIGVDWRVDPRFSIYGMFGPLRYRDKKVAAGVEPLDEKANTFTGGLHISWGPSR